MTASRIVIMAQGRQRRCPDRDLVAPGLWMGSAPACGVALPFDVLVLCAMEYQPDATCFGSHLRKVIRVRLDDAVPSTAEIRAAAQAARRVADLARTGRRVLVTCMQGRNRSGLVTGLVLRELHDADPDDVIDAIRRARGPSALSNPWFRWTIRVYHPTRGRRRETCSSPTTSSTT